MNICGLILNFLGAVLLGLSAQLGVGTAWGGSIIWKNNYWRWSNIVGWCLLALGFLMQLF
jgi:hypothetical protein